MNFITSSKSNSPLIISHRGLSAIFPQNTILSIQTALFQSDFAEFDVILTKDQEIIVFHDSYLSRLTDIEQHQEFKNRKRLDKQYDVEKNDWWIVDFTLQQLKTLKLKQGQHIQKRPSHFNNIYKIPTLEQLIDSVLQLKKQYKHLKSGFLLQIKSDEKVSDILGQKIIKLLRQKKLSTVMDCEVSNLPIILQSFEEKILKKIRNETDLPFIQLIEIQQKYDLKDIKKYGIGIGITDKNLINTDFKLIQQCHKQNLIVLYFTLRNDEQVKGFNYKQISQVILKLYQIGIDGYITQFPQYTAGFIKAINTLKS